MGRWAEFLGEVGHTWTWTWGWGVGGWGGVDPEEFHPTAHNSYFRYFCYCSFLGGMSYNRNNGNNCYGPLGGIPRRSGPYLDLGGVGTLGIVLSINFSSYSSSIRDSGGWGTSLGTVYV